MRAALFMVNHLSTMVDIVYVQMPLTLQVNSYFGLRLDEANSKKTNSRNCLLFNTKHFIPRYKLQQYITINIQVHIKQ